MDLNTILVVLAIVIVVAIFVFFPEARALLKGMTRVFIKDMATTPEGAEAIYSEKIEEAQEAFNIADDAYKQAAGKLSTAQKKREQLKERLVAVEKVCEDLVRSGKMEMAQVKCEEREEIASDIKRYDKLVATYAEATKTAKEAQEVCERNLRALRKESKEVVENIKMKIELKGVYDSMDELKNVTATDKLLDSVRDKNKDLDAYVEGSRVAHSNKMSTKLEKAEAEARKSNSNDYLESLKKKYNK